MNSDGRERRFFVHLRSCAGDEDLKQGTLRGGLAKICAQVRHFLLRVGSLRIMARLLNPRDFGSGMSPE